MKSLTDKISVADQIIQFIEAHREKVNRESFCTVEFVIQANRLDGMRVKEYVKNKNC